MQSMSALISRSRWMTAATYTITLFVIMTLGTNVAQAAEGNRVNHIIQSLLWFWAIIFLLISVALIALCVLLLLDVRMAVAIPHGFVDEFTDTVNKRRFKEAFDMARNDTSYLARVLTAGMSRLQYGLEDAREAAANMLEGIRSEKDQKNAYTGVIGTLGPLIGLVGTVWGMIGAFQQLASTKPGQQAEAKDLAADISVALSITIAGIALAVPALFAYSFFRNRIIHVTMDTGHIADDLLTQMYHNSKKAGATPSTAGATPSASGEGKRG